MMDLVKLLDRVKDGVLREAETALECSRLQHYVASEPEANAARLCGLYEALLASAHGSNLLPMIRHAERIARDRHEGGFDLAEVQTAFNLLEEALWRRIASDLPPDRSRDALRLVSTILGAGKQALAQQYVLLATKAHAPALDVDALFAGG